MGKFVFILLDFVWFGAFVGGLLIKVDGKRGIGKLGSRTRYIRMDFSHAAHIFEGGEESGQKRKGRERRRSCVGSCLSER